ncbi:helix-turn-helix domain-containing protein [Paenibacillus daejeonensis]|uniref:helix-turn-helix domain-containing protein n=1 Tax=Paenibacillus daejeonensis TaxID=135193 RepID=UPI00037C286E|nr:helix-turn-helix domain-containing protein [Paenibacillus daejeonensis]
MRSFNGKLFRQYFSVFFLSVIIPTMVASILTHSYVVGLIENQLEQSNDKVITNFSESNDALFSSLQADMINFLRNSNLQEFLSVIDEGAHARKRSELAYSLINQIRMLESEGIVTNAFLVFIDHDMVLDKNTYTTKDYYFDWLYVVSEEDKKRLLGGLSGSKVMDFTQPYSVKQPITTYDMNDLNGTNISTVMSYPFNTVTPEVYLFLSLDRSRLSDHLRVQEDWNTAMAIIDDSGNIISKNGELASEPGLLAEQLEMKMEDTMIQLTTSERLSFTQSQFNPSWYYVSAVDWQLLMKPARLIQTFSLWFLVFFFIVGGLASYLLSRKIYTPIMEIKAGLAPHSRAFVNQEHGGNDFEVIKQFSGYLKTENKELTQLVGMMLPVVQENFVSKLLLGEFRDSLSIEMYAKEIQLPFERNMTFVVFCIDLSYYARHASPISESTKSFMVAELKENIRKELEEIVWFCSPQSDMIACVLIGHSFNDDEVQRTARNMRQALKAYASFYNAAIGVGTVVEKVEHLALSYNHAKVMLKQKSLFSDIKICSEKHASDDRMAWERFLSHEEINQMINFYKSRNYDRLLETALDLLDEGIGLNAPESLVKNLCYDILNTWIRALESGQKDSGLSYYSSLFERVERCVTWDELKDCLRDIHHTLFQSTKTHELQEQFDDVLKYIDNHYGDDLSIEHFSQQMGMSAGHFSRMFKEVVGEKYVEYITRYRMEKAKQLLLETDLIIDDIACRIGYFGRNSFTRVFRKYEGVTPGIYRTSQKK